MPSAGSASKPGSLKDPDVAALFSTKDPDARYEDLREIGHGSFGAVFFAHDKETKQAVAIKKMGFSGAQAMEKWNDIVREVRFLKSVRHRHIVEYRNCYLKENSCWLVMEYCIGSAADIVEVHKKPLLEGEIAAICEQALLGLRFIHGKNRIHRDVKAGNILLTDAGTVKLADLGSASLLSPAQSFVGTPYWMAPEVILAMDEGQYDVEADIWSFGITCIELAERRPPLFKMNAMSALYHIAQNDPPSLSSTIDVFATDSNGNPISNGGETNGAVIPAPWSDRFHSFVEGCLRKDPQQRLSTDACLQHSFITENRVPDCNVIMELILRTKDMVRELDQFQYKRMRKLMYLDDKEARLPGVEGSAANEEAGCEIDELFISDPRTQVEMLTEAAELASQNSNPSRAGTLERSRLRSQQQGSDDNRTLISVGCGSGGGREGSVASAGFADAETPSTSSSQSISRNQSVVSGSGGRQGQSSMEEAAEKINTLRWSKFSTLRTTKVISREVEEYKRDDNMYEQMVGYKRLRQQHHKEMKGLEERCSAESATLQQRQDREYDQLIAAGQKEQQKVRTQVHVDMERQRRDNEEALKRFRKQKISEHEHQFKSFVSCQKREYKYNKDRAKSELKDRRTLSRPQIETAMKVEKVRLKGVRMEAERNFAEEQGTSLEAALKEARHKQVLDLYSMESRLLTNEWNIRARQLDTRHALLKKHHDVTAEMDVAHFRESETMKKRHMDTQHALEAQNQTSYTKRTLDDIKKHHALQSKQQPRDLKAKEMQIRKQFRQTVKIQTRQFKAYQSQILQTVPKEEQKDLIARLKEEQSRKIAALAEQYESTIQTMITEQTVKLEAWQEEDIKSHSEKLQKELAMLTTFQERQKLALCAACERERIQLQDRTNLRLSVLNQKMNEELVKFEQDKEKCFRALNERKIREEKCLTGEKSPFHQSSVSTSSHSSSRSYNNSNHVIGEPSKSSGSSMLNHENGGDDTGEAGMAHPEEEAQSHHTQL